MRRSGGVSVTVYAWKNYDFPQEAVENCRSLRLCLGNVSRRGEQDKRSMRSGKANSGIELLDPNSMAQEGCPEVAKRGVVGAKLALEQVPWDLARLA